jgi:DNA-binding transcriptional ArsR family regulator
MVSWNFLTTHGRTMLFIARQPDARLRDIAQALNITERTVTAIVKDLTDTGYIIRSRDGRRNRYLIQHTLPLHGMLGSQPTVDDLLQALGQVQSDDASGHSSPNGDAANT